MIKISGSLCVVNRSSDLLAANARLLKLRQQHSAKQPKSSYNPQQRPVTTVTEPLSVPDSQSTTSGWLSPLKNILRVEHEPSPSSLQQENVESETRTPEQPNETVRVLVSLLTTFLKHDIAAIGRIWLLAKKLDLRGCGWLPIEQLKTALTTKSAEWRICGWRRLRQLLQQGQNLLWERDSAGRIWLYSPQQVAKNLDIDRLGKQVVLLPIQPLIENIAATRAAFYASFHAARSSAPISRATLTVVTGVSERAQRTYDQLANVSKKTNISLGETVNDQLSKSIVYESGGGMFVYEDRAGKFGRKGTRYHARQLPNSYVATYQTVCCKRLQKRYRRMLQDLVKQEAQGNEQHTSTVFKRRFFQTHAQAMAAFKKQESGYWQLNDQSKVGVWCLW